MIIVNPWLTEKATNESEKGLYSFLVLKSANKSEIAKEIERMFKVKVQSVTTLVNKGKVINMRRKGKSTAAKRNDTKKAVVRLEKGQKLNIYPEENK